MTLLNLLFSINDLITHLNVLQDVNQLKLRFQQSMLAKKRTDTDSMNLRWTSKRAKRTANFMNKGSKNRK